MRFFFACISFVLAGVVANAQVTTSSISGKVVDSEGPVAGAAIIATYTPSGSNYYTVTDANGAYRINAVTPGGPYTVVVDMLGYRTAEFTGVYAPLAEVVKVDATLEVESLGLEAAVFVADGTNSSMNIDRSGAGTSVSQKTMAALPTSSRSMNDVLKLTPQASTTSNGLAVGGGNYRSSYVTVDGAAFNNAFGIGSNLPAGGTPISLDALEQMSVNITPFDVRQSGFTGGAINAVTKSGTNEFHASVYNYYKSEKITGYKVGDNDVTKSDYLDNVTGVTIGGPIIKNKLFFFVNFEYALDTQPGSSRSVRTSEDQAFGGSTGYVRPTESFMEEVSSYLMETYGYNPGRYQGYSLKTPDWKLLARLDWNINDNHKFNIRYSQTMNKYSSSPSSSVNPLSPNPYNRNTYGRTSDYAMYFESQRYYQEQNFMSLAAELNSRFMDGRLNNLLRVTWSHQDEPRSFEGANFPTVDILENITEDYNGQALSGETRAVLTSFGPDPFTYGNLRDVQTIVGTDEISYRTGIHNIVGGLQYEWNRTKNGYMQGGLGYYVYASWEDFVNDATPVAFAITHSNRDDLAQVYPSFDYMQASWYLQDEISFSDYFKLTAGIRFEVPIYPTIDGNENKEFTSLATAGTTLYGHKTSDMPNSSVNVSPRIGFNWDILHNRNLILRGGSGVYTGRIPFVWIVSVVGNSNTMQAQYITSNTSGYATDAPSFHTNVSDILEDLYGGTYTAQDLYAPTSATLLDKNLKMPTTWKSSLALDVRLPWGIKGTLEGIYNYDIESVYVDKLGIVQSGTVTLPGEPSSRPYYVSEGIKNSMGGTVSPYYVYNVDDIHGYYYSITAQLQKDFPFGLSLMAAYTRSDSKTLSDGLGDQVSSAYNTMTYNVNGTKNPELGHSTYVSPNRLIANVSYRIQEGKNLATTLSAFYEGYNYGYVGSYSYTRYSYTINNQTGDGGAANLMYIPTDSQLESMPFSSDENKASFKEFLSSDKYLKKHRGEYSERGAIAMPWVNRINIKVAQDFMINVGKKTHDLQVAVDINNVANLLNSDWGTLKQLSTDQILTYSNGVYTFTKPTWSKYNSTYSTWNMMLSVKYSF